MNHQRTPDKIPHTALEFRAAKTLLNALEGGPLTELSRCRQTLSLQ